MASGMSAQPVENSPVHQDTAEHADKDPLRKMHVNGRGVQLTHPRSSRVPDRLWLNIRDSLIVTS
jgi:hypothetical protein